MSISRYLKLRGMNWSTSGLEWKYIQVSQTTGLVSQATGMELEYVKVSLKLRRWNLSVSSYGDGIGVYQGISSYGYLKVSQATEMEFEYLKVSKLRGWNWSTSGLELEYIKVSQATGLVSQATGL